MWKRLIPIPTFRAGVQDIEWPDYLGSFLTHRAQLTEQPGQWFDRMIRHIPEDNFGNCPPYYNWTPSAVITAYKRMKAEREGTAVNYEDMTCPQCNGTGIISISNGDKKWRAWCMCQLSTKLHEFSIQHKKLSFNYEPAQLKDFKVTNQDGSKNLSFITAKRASDEFIKDPSMAWLVLTGRKGLGKTYCLRAIDASFGAGVACSIRVADIVNKCFMLLSQGGLEEYIETVRNVPILLLDDLNASNMQIKGVTQTDDTVRMSFPMVVMQGIIDYRWNHREMFPTVITTNESMDSLRTDTWGILGDRIADNANWIVALDGESHRQWVDRMETEQWTNRNS